MKSFLVVLVCVFCSITWVKGDAANELYIKGTDALAAGDYAGAVKLFDQVIKDYPSTQSIDEIRVRAGFAYIHMGDYTSAVDRLARETLPEAKAEYRGTALYYTALAQLYQGSKLMDTDKVKANASLKQAEATFTTLIDYITTSPNPNNKDYLEDAIYNQSLAYFQGEDYAATEKDLLRLTSKEFATSLRRPDYFLLLGSLYYAEAIDIQNASKPDEPSDKVRAVAAKAIAAFDVVSTDPNALVQGNEANMRKGEVLFLLAPLDLPKTDGYQQALDAFRLVRRKEDVIKLQQDRLKQLRDAEHARLASSPTAVLSSGNLLIDREQNRLDELQKAPDPIIQALIRIADCYNAMKQSDEARTILHRLAVPALYAKLTPDQQKDVDFQTLYSYVLGGQTEKADKALTDYLAKHVGDPQADSLSYQMAASLMQRKDFEGALKQAKRSLNDFASGRYAAQAVSLEASALQNLGRNDESNKVITDFVAKNPKSPVAMQLLLTDGQNKLAQGDPAGALAAFKQVSDNPDAGDMRAIGAAASMQAYQALGKQDDLIAASKEFATKYPTNKALPGVLVMGAVAMDQKHDPAAVDALQAVIDKFPEDPTAPWAAAYIVNIYQRQSPVATDKMIAAADALAKKFPDAYPQLAQVADAVTGVYLKQKKFDQAIALYQHLSDAPKPEVAATAHNKIGTIWLAAAKSMGSYQSLKEADRPEAQKRLTSAEEAFVGTLKQFPDQLNVVGDSFQGLVDVMVLRRSWGLLQDSGFADYLGKITSGLTTPDMQTRVAMAKAGLVFTLKDGTKQFQAGLDAYKKAADANPSLALTRQEASQFGELLIWGKDYARAEDVFNKLLATADPADQTTQADGFYGMGAAYFAQGDLANAKTYFTRLKKLNQGASWHPHITDADYALAFIAEGADDVATAKPIYASIMRAPQAGFVLQAKAMLGYGRILEKAGTVVKQPNQQDNEYAVNYYQQVDNLFGPAVPLLSAEGLYDAGQAFAKAGDKANAKIQYQKLIDGYATTAPAWVEKAKAEIAKLGP